MSSAEPTRSDESKPLKKLYEKPRVESHVVFEASLACVKVTGAAPCSFSVRRSKS